MAAARLIVIAALFMAAGVLLLVPGRPIVIPIALACAGLGFGVWMLLGALPPFRLPSKRRPGAPRYWLVERGRHKEWVSAPPRDVRAYARQEKARSRELSEPEIQKIGEEWLHDRIGYSLVRTPGGALKAVLHAHASSRVFTVKASPLDQLGMKLFQRRNP